MSSPQLLFSKVCVKNSVYKGLCVAKGGYAWQGGMRGSGGACVGGACMAVGLCLAKEGGACVARETATTADGTHPTGMYSCSVKDYKETS